MSAQGCGHATSASIGAGVNGPIPFHRLFGLSWIDFFNGTDVEVVTEIDLSLKEQFLDLVLIRKGSNPLPRRLPDGFDLSDFNLITFKSYQEALDSWACSNSSGTMSIIGSSRAHR